MPQQQDGPAIDPGCIDPGRQRGREQSAHDPYLVFFLVVGSTVPAMKLGLALLVWRSV
jgi:hypothetical protein